MYGPVVSERGMKRAGVVGSRKAAALAAPAGGYKLAETTVFAAVGSDSVKRLGQCQHAAAGLGTHAGYSLPMIFALRWLEAWP